MTIQRKSTLPAVNDWKKLYSTFSDADFQSYDFETLRKTFIDYLKANYPETFNDYVESSEYMGLLDVIAMMGQSLAFRSELNARENFIDTAERRDSLVRLASLVGYTPKRCKAASGWLKLTSIRTSEDVIDLNGNNLNSATILFNDSANDSWFEQINTIINAALINSQRVGRPANSQTILNVKTDEYSISLPQLITPVIKFSSSVRGQTMDFEFYSASSVNSLTVYEKSPSPTNQFNILYRNDKQGFGSANSGFFIPFKQGSLAKLDVVIQQKLPNFTYDVDVPSINNDDVWLFEYDQITDTYTEWKKVNSIVSYDQSLGKKVFEVKTRGRDAITLVFGDDVFSESPVGKFKLLVRQSNGESFTIEPSEMRNISFSIPYLSKSGKTETLSMTFALQQSVNNAETTESNDSIRLRAPVQYYSQNRMVNGEDYNTLPFTLFSSVLRCKALNRTSIGVSRSKDLLDPTGKYSKTQMSANDGALFTETKTSTETVTFIDSADIAKFFVENVKSILSMNGVKQRYFATAPRYNALIVEGGDTDNKVYFKKATTTRSNCTGYFFTYIGSDASKVELSKAVGTFTSDVLKFVTVNSILKFRAPAGFYFDDQNRLIPGTGSKVTTFVNVIDVIGDGHNNGDKQFSDGSAPITLSANIGTGAILEQIIPSFDNTLSTQLVQECIKRIKLGRSFSLNFNNSLSTSIDRWQIVTFGNFALNFKSEGSGVYTVTYPTVKYFFGSASDVRFAVNVDRAVYDRNNGVRLLDTINLENVEFSAIDQRVESDGLVDDFAVEVSSLYQYDRSLPEDPDFFAKLVPNNSHVFLEQFIDSDNLTRFRIVPNSEITVVSTKNAALQVMADYPTGQIFYCSSENKFYFSETVLSVMTLTENQSFVRKNGKDGIRFTYIHYSPESNRVDPGTSNIIDLYIVTRAYNDAYRAFLLDQSGKVSEPQQPTMNELSIDYVEIQKYKMLSDTVLLNSVQFKPLFGQKADPALRATFKVTKASQTTASDSEVRSKVLQEINDYFSIENWDFGESFYFSELSAHLHKKLDGLISSVILVANDTNAEFGALYEIKCKPNEIFVSSATANDIIVINTLSPRDFKA